MRTDNRKVKNTVVSIYFILIVFGILLATVFKSFEFLTESTFFVFFGLFVFFIYNFIHKSMRFLHIFMRNYLQNWIILLTI